MHPDKKNKFKHIEAAFETNPIASATEFTGLAPVIPATEQEADSLSQLFDVPVTHNSDIEKTEKHKNR